MELLFINIVLNKAQSITLIVVLSLIGIFLFSFFKNFLKIFRDAWTITFARQDAENYEVVKEKIMQSLIKSMVESPLTGEELRQVLATVIAIRYEQDSQEGQN